ncbi:hypothetical protein V1280_008770 [Bradyrhizobium sp. AZCC 2230]
MFGLMDFSQSLNDIGLPSSTLAPRTVPASFGQPSSFCGLVRRRRSIDRFIVPASAYWDQHGRQCRLMFATPPPGRSRACPTRDIARRAARSLTPTEADQRVKERPIRDGACDAQRPLHAFGWIIERQPFRSAHFSIAFDISGPSPIAASNQTAAFCRNDRIRLPLDGQAAQLRLLALNCVKPGSLDLPINPIGPEPPAIDFLAQDVGSLLCGGA